MRQTTAQKELKPAMDHFGMSSLSFEFIPTYGVPGRKTGYFAYFRDGAGKLHRVGDRGLSIEKIVGHEFGAYCRGLEATNGN